MIRRKKSSFDRDVSTKGILTVASSFAYDKADRLTAIIESDKHTAYTLDGMGNRVEVREGATVLNAQRKYTAEFNARNQLTEQKQYADNAITATTAFHYDPNGNLIRQSTGGMDTEWRYDILDRLIETTPPTGPPTQYNYGPGDVRIAKIRNGVEVRYHYDGERITLETNTLGNPQRHYVYSAAGLLNTTILGTTPQYRSSHLDAMGSPVLITGSDGSIISRTRFDAWGVEHSLFGTRDQAIAFQGYWTGTELEETGTLLSAARLYIPSLGIFAERDPVEGTSNEPISFNPYLLGRANPQYWMDPDGRRPCESVRCDLVRARYNTDDAGQQQQLDAIIAKHDQHAAETVTGFYQAGQIAYGVAEGSAELVVTGAVELTYYVSDAVNSPFVVVSGGLYDVGATSRNEQRVQSLIEGTARFLNEPIETLMEPHRAAKAEFAKGNFVGVGRAYAPYAMSLYGASATARNLANEPRGSRRVVKEGSGPEVRLADLDNNAQGRQIEYLAADALGNRGLTFVGENLGKPRNAAMQAARDFESGTVGAFSDIATGQRQVPALRFDNPNPRGAPYVKFDGYQHLDSGTVELIDSKTRIVPFATKDGPFVSPSVRDGLINKSLALTQNPGYAGVIELPTAAARREAQQVLRQLGITNISTRVREQ